MASATDRHVSFSEEWPSDALKFPAALSDTSPSRQQYLNSDSPSNVSHPQETYINEVDLVSSVAAEQPVNSALSDVTSAASAFSVTSRNRRELYSAAPTQCTSSYASTGRCTSFSEEAADLGPPMAHDSAQSLPTLRHLPQGETLLGSIAPSDATTLGLHQSKDAFCEWNTVTRITDYSTDNTTACSIAFSIIFQHNKRGLSTAELESRLQAGYLNAQMASEDCRILNQVLFSVLAEIS